MGLFLIADDSPPKRVMLHAALKRARWDGEIMEASTTEEAMALIDGHPSIAAAFIDYQMPSANGPAVIAHLRSTNPAAKIALVTAADNATYEQEARAAGAEAFICTSWTGDHLERVLQETLRHWQAA